MNYPSLPTDATYKLILIVGILLIIYSGYEAKKNVNFSLYSEYKTDSLGNQFSYLMDYREANFKRIDSDTTILGQIKQDSLARFLHFCFSSQFALEKEEAVFRVKTKQFDMDTYFSLFLLCLGSSLSTYGFIKWNKQQKIDDMIKYKQLQILDLEYQSKLNPSKPDLTKYKKR